MPSAMSTVSFNSELAWEVFATVRTVVDPFGEPSRVPVPAEARPLLRRRRADRLVPVPLPAVADPLALAPEVESPAESPAERLAPSADRCSDL